MSPSPCIPTRCIHDTLDVPDLLCKLDHLPTSLLPLPVSLLANLTATSKELRQLVAMAMQQGQVGTLI